MNDTAKKPRLVKVRSYEFEYGLLHLKESERKGMTDEEVAENYGVGKGRLLEAWDDMLPLKFLNSLEDFRDL